MAGVVAFHRLALCVLVLLSLEVKGKGRVVELTRGEGLFVYCSNDHQGIRADGSLRC